MKIELNTNNGSNVNFGYYRIPKKKTYAAMKGYYSLITDKSSAVEYGFLANQAKARLHNIKSKQSMEKYNELVGQTVEENYKSIGELVKNNLKATGYLLRSLYEKTVSGYYYYLKF
jgi:hypothetical protein